jgi:hypothetical protein
MSAGVASLYLFLCLSRVSVEGEDEKVVVLPVQNLTLVVDLV